jgi:hypothetical protein
MKAAISYTCSCGTQYLVSINRDETPEEAAGWRERLEDVAAGLGVGVVEPKDVARCPRCGTAHGDVADVAVAAD